MKEWKIKVRTASGMTYKLADDDKGYFQIMLDLDFMEVIAIYHWTQNEWNEHPRLLDLMHVRRHVTMKELRDVAERVYKEYKEYKGLRY